MPTEKIAVEDKIEINDSVKVAEVKTETKPKATPKRAVKPKAVAAKPKAEPAKVEAPVAEVAKPKAAPAPAAKKPETTTPGKTNNMIKLNISPNCKIPFTNMPTGRKGIINANGNKILLQRSHIYVLPLSDEKLDIDNFNVIKLNKETSKKLSVLTIDNGNIFVIPLIHGVMLNDGDELGMMI
jgi:hypothetical protein